MTTLSSSPSVVLLLEDDSAMRTSLTAMLAGSGCHLLFATTTSEAEVILGEHAVDMVICDVRFELGSGNSLLQRFRSRSPLTESLLIIGPDNNASSIASIQSGNCDYLAKPFLGAELSLKVAHGVRLKRMREEIAVLREHIAMTYGFDNIVGISSAIAQLKETAARVAPTDIPILITGASGTGKELVARAIHHHSNRRKNRFVVVDCRAIPEAILESELFGQLPAGADSPAMGRPGLLAEADKGTVYIDHVATMSPSMQTKLHRFMQESTVTPVGGTDSRKVDVRVIAASDQDLHALVASGDFREDLLYRLGVIPLEIHPLADRPEDIDVLADYILRRTSREMGRSELSLSPGVQTKLIEHSWPGNVRELENTIKRAVALAKGNVIHEQDIQFIGLSTSSGEVPASVERRRPLVETQRDLIRRALEFNDWNYTQTANELGIGRTTLWRKVKKFNLAKQ